MLISQLRAGLRSIDLEHRTPGDLLSPVGGKVQTALLNTSNAALYGNAAWSGPAGGSFAIGVGAAKVVIGLIDWSVARDLDRVSDEHIAYFSARGRRLVLSGLGNIGVGVATYFPGGQLLAGGLAALDTLDAVNAIVPDKDAKAEKPPR